MADAIVADDMMLKSYKGRRILAASHGSILAASHGSSQGEPEREGGGEQDQDDECSKVAVFERRAVIIRRQVDLRTWKGRSLC